MVDDICMRFTMSWPGYVSEFRPIARTGHKFEVWMTSGSEIEPLNGTFVDHVPKDTVIVIYGDMGKSEQLPLVAEEDDTSSSPGNTQYFKVIIIYTRRNIC